MPIAMMPTGKKLSSKRLALCPNCLFPVKRTLYMGFQDSYHCQRCGSFEPWSSRLSIRNPNNPKKTGRFPTSLLEVFGNNLKKLGIQENTKYFNLGIVANKDMTKFVFKESGILKKLNGFGGKVSPVSNLKEACVSSLEKSTGVTTKADDWIYIDSIARREVEEALGYDSPLVGLVGMLIHADDDVFWDVSCKERTRVLDLEELAKYEDGDLGIDAGLVERILSNS